MSRGTFSDYHDNGRNANNSGVSRVDIVGSLVPETTEVGIFRCQALHYDFGFGLNVSAALCSRLLKLP